MSLFGRIISFNLRTKFVVPISAMLVAGLLVVSTYLINRQSEGYLRELETSGRTMIQMLAINAESDVLFESRYELEELLSVLSQFDNVTYAVIRNQDGTILAQTGVRGIDTSVVIRELITPPANERLTGFYCVDSREHEILVLTAPIITRRTVTARENLGMAGFGAGSQQEIIEEIGSVELGLAVESVNAKIEEAKALAILLTLVVVIASVFVLAYIVSAVTRPITRLVEVTDQISRGDLDQWVDIDRRDEIGHLAKTFNKMIESLRQYRQEIEEHNRTLEEKIIERTQQLEEAQAQLIQSEKMSAIGQLAAGVAHELNNPLGGILGYAQFTLEKLRKNVPEKTTAREIQSYIKYVSDIEIQARRCKSIVQNLLRFSRTSRTVDFEEVDINTILKETLTFIEHQLHMADIELRLSLADDLPKLRGNPSQLQQVFTNLILNAMHAMDGGGVLSITSRLSPALGEFSGAVELIFSDTGCGIPPENLKKIFEPFFTTKEVGRGTGLGLSVSYGIIREHGGEINVASEPGRGTTFTIVLPVQKPAPAADKKNVAK